MKLRCLIVDDETLAQDVIEKYIGTLPTLELVGKCENAIEAISFLHNNKVDLMFLDLNMPELSGLDMLKTLQDPPKVILTTAYSEYALESYEYGVEDYLLKPIKFERFIKAVNKVVQNLLNQHITKSDSGMDEEISIFLKEDQVIHRVKLNDILFVEAYGNYLKVNTQLKLFVVRETMHDMEARLPREKFIRVHKSYIISVSKILSLSGNRVYVADHEIPVGEMYKLGVKELLSRDTH